METLVQNSMARTTSRGIDMNYELYDEDEHNYYFLTGRITGGFFKSQERIALCKQCGMEYVLPQRHGPIDLEDSYPRGISSGICTECGLRFDSLLQFMTHEIEYTAVCQKCIETHHGLDYFSFKYRICKMLLCQWRLHWNRRFKSDLEKVC